MVEEDEEDGGVKVEAQAVWSACLVCVVGGLGRGRGSETA